MTDRVNHNSDLTMTEARHALSGVRYRRSIGEYSRAIRKKSRSQTLSRIMAGTSVMIGIYLLLSVLIKPLGIEGVMGISTLIALYWIATAYFSRVRPVKADDLPRADLRQLAGKTEIWLEQQRPALPAPAQMAAQSIGTRLDQLGLQLETLDPNTPAAAEVRKLVGEDLPELVKSYNRVPTSLRDKASAGTTPNQQLSDGLKVIESEIDRMARQIASGDMDALATRSRYLEIKYQGEGNTLEGA